MQAGSDRLDSQVTYLWKKKDLMTIWKYLQPKYLPIGKSEIFHPGYLRLSDLDVQFSNQV